MYNLHMEKHLYCLNAVTWVQVLVFSIISDLIQILVSAIRPRNQAQFMYAELWPQNPKMTFLTMFVVWLYGRQCCWSATLVHTEIPQQLSDGLAQKTGTNIRVPQRMNPNDLVIL